MFRFTRAVVRRPAANYTLGLTTGDPGQGDPARFGRQHQAYIEALSDAGLKVDVLPALEDLPDAHFVEDVAVIVPGLVVITRPGAVARRAETQHIEAALRDVGETVRIVEPGTLDAGDVLFSGDRCYIGLSDRSNPAGVTQLAWLLEARGFRCQVIRVAEGLHLKSSVNLVAEDTLVTTAALEFHEAFRDHRRIRVDADEAYAANVCRVNDRLLLPAGYPRILQRIDELQLGIGLVPLEISEARRMDGGLTCLSLRY